MTLPTTAEKRLQLVPSWYESTKPETTPMANDTAKILVQNRASRCRCSWPVTFQRTSRVAMKAAVPMVKLGKIMWNVMVNANCRRASSSGSSCMARDSRGEKDSDRKSLYHKNDGTLCSE